MSKKSEITNQEILQAINDFSTDVDKRFDSIDYKFDKVEGRLGNLEHNQTDILSKLNNVAYKFEIRDLERRVETLETK